MAEQMELGDILSDAEPEAPEAPERPETTAQPETAVAAEPAEKAERPQSRRQQARDKEMDARGLTRDPETGQYRSKEASPAAPEAPAKPEPAAAVTEPAKPVEPAAAAPAQPEMTEKEKAFFRAAQDERNKRQELERRLAALEASRAQPAQSGQPEQPKTFWDDPEGFLAKQQAESRRESINTKLQIAETFARQRHTDFDEKVAKFSELVQSTPGLAQQWVAQADPAEFAYSTAKNHMELQQAGSIEELRAKIERETSARVRTQIEAELKAKADELAKQRAELPGSLSEAQGKGNSRPVWSGPESLDEIIAS